MGDGSVQTALSCSWSLQNSRVGLKSLALECLGMAAEEKSSESLE